MEKKKSPMCVNSSVRKSLVCRSEATVPKLCYWSTCYLPWIVCWVSTYTQTLRLLSISAELTLFEDATLTPNLLMSSSSLLIYLLLACWCSVWIMASDINCHMCGIFWPLGLRSKWKWLTLVEKNAFGVEACGTLLTFLCSCVSLTWHQSSLTLDKRQKDRSSRGWETNHHTHSYSFQCKYNALCKSGYPLTRTVLSKLQVCFVGWCL